MTEAVAEAVKEDAVVDDAAKVDDKTVVDDKAVKSADDAAKAKEADKSALGAVTEFVADPDKTDDENAAALAEWEKAQDEKGKDKGGLPDDWRDIAAGGDEDTLKLLKRYGSISGVAKALKEAQKAIRSGKGTPEMPDPTDEKAMKEWRKAAGVPDDPTGYTLPDDVTKRLTDDDKPILSSFTEFAHKNNARPDVVELGAKWYVEMEEAAAADRLEKDKLASSDAEDTLRKDWAHGEYKSNTTVAKRWISEIPGLGDTFTEVRALDGRRLGDIPEFVAWAAEQGLSKYGDLAFSNSDSERKHTARKEEIEKIMKTDINQYREEGLDKEYQQILEKELARKR